MRNPHHKERVYSISVNGSPIAAGNNEDIVINVPIGNGEVSLDFWILKDIIILPSVLCNPWPPAVKNRGKPFSSLTGSISVSPRMES